METYQGKGHTSLVTHTDIAISAPSAFGLGTFGSYTEGVVIKRPRRSILEEKTDGLISFITELRIRSHAALRSHPSIALFRGFAPQGALDNFWRNWKFVSLNFKTRLNFCMDIAEGLSALHHCGVVHGDVKPENIPVFPRKDARNSFSLRLTDFGHSVVEADDRKSLPAFTPQWSAPEVTKKTHMSFTQMKATDYYSLGLVIVSIMLGRPFYVDIEDAESFKEDGSILIKLVRLVEQEDRSKDNSDFEVGTIVRLLYKTSIVGSTTVDSTFGLGASNRCSGQAWELTICYFSGFGVPRDFDHALEWLSLARDRHVSAGQEFFKPLNEAIAVARGAHDNGDATSAEQINVDFEGEAKITALDSNIALPPLQVDDCRNGGTSGQHSTSTAGNLAESDTAQGRIPEASIEELLRKYLDEDRTNTKSDSPARPEMNDRVRDAIKTGSVDQVRDSINSHPAQIDSVDEHGNTPLLLAAEYRQVGVLRYLLSHPGVEAHAHNNSGQTALHSL
ncbi:hypothetical protein CPLU01_10433 [Colletotrichum plurivorum]|uniref:Protein kinase domain-containing protein n=1 Tax=Colletotrichum plurivorum TaxID=2175906 RepID=A0A8H6K5J8_9PEZI|nr:hypothetical protein CPLU01_10433 [Colletotrichum plurivorum]